MIPRFRERRRSDRFAALLDHAENGRRPHRRTEADSELLPLVDLARTIGATDAPEPSEDFRTGLRSLLLATIRREGIGATESDRRAPDPTAPPAAAVRSALTARTLVVPQVPARRGTSARARAAVLGGITAGALALSGVSLASTDSLPGDALYSVKRSSEQAQLALAMSESSRGQLHLEFARSRLDEAYHVDPGAVSGVLLAMNAETVAGARLLFSAAMSSHSASPIDTVMAFVARQRMDLTHLPATVPDAAGATRTSLELLRDIEARATLVRTAIVGVCTAGTQDVFGPKPDC